MTMELERAKRIVNAINHRCYYSMGLKPSSEMEDLSSVSLAEMLAATEAVDLRNKSLSKTPGPKTILIIPAERLIAAVYVLENYQPSGESVASKPFSKSTDICVGVVENRRGE